MAEHNELVAEMPILEQLGTQERQKLAKKRRLQQIKKWSQREKEWIAKEKQFNKRLANKIQEENNGLSLKQYTAYNSNPRAKKKIHISSKGTIVDTYLDHSPNGNKHDVNKNLLAFNNNVVESRPNSDSDNIKNNRSKLHQLKPPTMEDCKSLAPRGRVHFDTGVMLLEAAARNDYDEVKRLLMLGVSPDSVNHDGLTALHQCCIDASEPIMNLLLQFGAQVDARDTEQWTPLHAACACGHVNLVQTLIEHGADLLAVNGDGSMPLDICEDQATLELLESEMMKQDITQEMIDITKASREMQMISDIERQLATSDPQQQQANLNQADEHGVTQLHVAAANGYLSAVKLLLKHDVNVHACDNDLWQPIHGTVCWGTEKNAKIVELLIEAGANLYAKTINDETVFDLCGSPELLERLNQIKDDFESKRISDEDQPKRSQSRTNSRVHSIRRSTVRDKNQISRREAREEALLRAETRPIDTETDGNGTSKLDLLPANDQTVPGDIAQEPSQPLSRETSNSTIKQTDLDDEDCTTLDQETLGHSNDKQSSQHIMTGETVQQDAFVKQENSAASRRKHMMVKQNPVDVSTQSSHVISKPEDSSSENDVTSDACEKSQTQRAPTNGSHSPNLGSAEEGTASDIPNSVSEKQYEAALANGINTQKKSISDIDNHNSNRTTKSLDTSNKSQTHLEAQRQALQNQAQSLVVQFAPNNYTLSNLKKQRSDLRMRNSTLGGGSGSGTVSVQLTHTSRNEQLPKTSTPMGPGVKAFSCNTSSITVNSSKDQLTVSGSMANGQAKSSESPSISHRKFHGEPSEALGGTRGSRSSRNGNRRRSGCCVLI